MTRYSKEHWVQTHQAILRETAAEIRLNGPFKVSVADLMKKVGLTHGGFYAHFASKDILIADAIEWMFEDRLNFLNALFSKYGSSQGFARYIDHYLSVLHVKHPEAGCPVPSLATDITRMSTEIQARYFQGMAAMFTLIESQVPQAQVRSMFSEMVGALLIARTYPNPDAASGWLDSCRESLQARLLH